MVQKFAPYFFQWEISHERQSRRFFRCEIESEKWKNFFNIFYFKNDNRAASVRANMECDFEASLYGENKILYFTNACRQNIYVRSTDSERERAGFACNIHFIRRS